MRLTRRDIARMVEECVAAASLREDYAGLRFDGWDDPRGFEFEDRNWDRIVVYARGGGIWLRNTESNQERELGEIHHFFQTDSYETARRIADWFARFHPEAGKRYSDWQFWNIREWYEGLGPRV